MHNIFFTLNLLNIFGLGKGGLLNADIEFLAKIMHS